MKNIAAAFVKAQAEIETAIKDKKNPAFRSTYADLLAVVEAVKPALAKHGLGFIQEVTEREAGGVYVETVIVHESGETMRTGRLPIPVGKADAHGYGSAITYGKRYSLMAAFGVPAEDDDGGAASNPSPMRQAMPARDDANAVEAGLILDSLREAAMGGVDALQERFRAIPASATKAAVWQKHSASLKSAAEKADGVPA
jgi:hypothetical protein